MRRKIISGIIICVSALCLFNCKKESETEYVTASFKEWVLFQAGSYWVFLNEKSNLPDSTFINESPDYGFTPPDPGVTHYQIISYKILNGFIHGALLMANSDNPVLVYGDFYSDSDVLSGRVTDNTSNEVAQGCIVVDRFDSLIINNLKFYNVIHTRSTKDYSMKDYYFSKNIGLLKFSIKTSSIDSTWSLLRWHVVQ